MSVAPAFNTINPQHLVTPDRVIVPEPTTRAVVPNPKPFDGLPGVVPFYRMLRAENLASPYRVKIERPLDTFEPSMATQRASTAQDSSVNLLPKLGEVLPVAPYAPASIKVEQTRQVQLPATGRVLDIYL
jgi:hypothetical protein